MNYFVTGASGFIGRFLLAELLRREDAEVYVLVRSASRARFTARLADFGARAARVHVVEGDITCPTLVAEGSRGSLPERIDHVFHLAAVYDMGMSDAVAEQVNRLGTRYVVDFVNRLGPGVRFHHVSSIAVSGPYFEGVFRETDFDEGQDLAHPYYASKFDAERIVREGCEVPFRIYRPGIVVGHSETGVIDKIDGPYYFFGAVRRLAAVLPRLLPLAFVEGGRMPIVPVDYVVRAMSTIAHRSEVEGQVFALVPAIPPSAGELVATLFRVAGGPRIFRIRYAPAARIANRVSKVVGRMVPSFVSRWISGLVGIPMSVFGQLFTQTVFDDRQTRRALRGTGVRCPALGEYVRTIWGGWERDHFGRPLPEETAATDATGVDVMA